jgi:prepilin-type N-terminal cleavage/methylation domain-containing protein
MKRLNDRGFTIIELLIATVVFSVVLLVVTTGIVQFGRVYYKGVIQARTQERARAIVEDIAQNIQFSGAGVVSGPNTYCVGNRVYTYALAQQMDANHHVLVGQSGKGCGAYTPMNQIPLPAFSSTDNATELAGQSMMLLKLTVTPVNADLATVSVRLAYVASPTDLTNTGPTGTCQGLRVGGQYCAVAELTTTVDRRLK